MAEGLEIERKYSVAAGVAVPDLSGVAGVGSSVTEPAVQLEAMYFDTADLRLLRARIALRRRTGGHDAGWHVKLPGVGGRLEVQGPIDADDDMALPAEVQDAVRSRVRDAPLVPLARIQTTRTITWITDDAGVRRIEFADDAVRATDMRDGVVREWQEWEGEQIGDDPDAASALLDAIEPALLAAGAAVSDSPAKLAQALGGAVRPAAAPDAGTAGGAVREAIARHIEALHVDEYAVRRGGERAVADEAVHRMRTTIRRLRSLLALDTVVGGDGVPLRDGLRRSGEALGESRDLAVSAETAERLLAELPSGIPGLADARRRLLDEPRERSDVDRARATAVLDGGGHRELLDGLEALVATPLPGPDADLPASTVLPRLARDAGRRAAKRLRRAGDDEDALHAGRRAARRFRYLAEDLGDDAASPATRGRAKRAARALQTELGTHRDLTLLADELPFVAQRAAAAGENAFIYGVLSERARREAAEALADARAAALRLAAALTR